jgi:phytoene dehydrogenase-like protein
MSKNEVVIIGGGLGGLLSGAILAKEGYAVTLVEKNKNIGGSLQSYKRFGVTFDTGMHVFGGMQNNGNIYRICKYLDILNDFKIEEIDNTNCYNVFVAEDNHTYDIGQGINGFVYSLANYFPAQKQNIKRYLSAIYRIMDESDLYYLRKHKHNLYDYSKDYSISANQLINEYITDKKLQSVISSINTLYAGEKSITPAFLHAAISMVFIDGACRVVGGYQNFANALGNCIYKYGGKIITGEEVIRIKTRDKMVDYIETNKGITIKGDYIISAISPNKMLDIMDDSNVFTNAYKTFIRDSKDSYSAFIINIKLKENTLPYSNQISFYLERYDSDWSVSDGTSVEKFMYMTPPSENQGFYARTLNVTAIMKWDAVKRWENTSVGKRGDEYIKWKQFISDIIIRKIGKIIPKFDDMIEDVDTASPLTIRDYTAVRNGAMCGIRKNCNEMVNSFIPIKTKVKNLFLTGQNCNFHGFCGVSLTAVQTCESLLGENFLIDKLNEIK